MCRSNHGGSPGSGGCLPCRAGKPAFTDAPRAHGRRGGGGGWKMRAFLCWRPGPIGGGTAVARSGTGPGRWSPLVARRGSGPGDGGTLVARRGPRPGRDGTLVGRRGTGPGSGGTLVGRRGPGPGSGGTLVGRRGTGPGGGGPLVAKRRNGPIAAGNAVPERGKGVPHHLARKRIRNRRSTNEGRAARISNRPLASRHHGAGTPARRPGIFHSPATTGNQEPAMTPRDASGAGICQRTGWPHNVERRRALDVLCRVDWISSCTFSDSCSENSPVL
ncbi:MAG: hypothetical protein RL088_1518 [Verrucomicrobiota bacterium]|jgi:hypothetical protein